MLNGLVVSIQTKCDNLKSAYMNMAGEREQKLNDTLESIKVIRQAYHGNVMVGNHCVLVLKEFKMLTDVIVDKDECEKFNAVFDLFRRIMNLVMARCFLFEDKINSLEILCYEFGTIFPAYLPYRNITRKIRELVFNVPCFVRKHKTIGMLSEQDGESKHAAVNAELCPLCWCSPSC